MRDNDMRPRNLSPSAPSTAAEIETGIQFAFDPPRVVDGTPLLICDGVWWIPLPIESSLEYVNVYALRDGNCLTLVDTGTNTTASKECLKRALQSKELSPYKLNRVIITHYHPDHIGYAGGISNQGTELWMSRTCWLQSTLLIATTDLLPSNTEVAFMRAAGMQGIELEAFKRQSTNRYSKLVDPLPTYFTPLSEGQVIKIGDRQWTVHVGNGHAAEHLTLWSNDLVILGDQVLPVTASNLTVPYSEPDADVVDEWFRSCEFLSRLSNNQILCLPGHNRPFRGLSNRIKQLQINMTSSIDKLKKMVVRSTSAMDCLEKFHGENMNADTRRRRLPELYGFLTYLVNQGYLERKRNDTGVSIYKKHINNQQASILMHMPALERRVGLVPDSVKTEVVASPQHSIASVTNTSSSPRVAIGIRMSVAAAILAMLGTGVYFYRDRLNDLGSNIFNPSLLSSNDTKPVLNLASTSKTYVQFLTLQELTATRLPRKFAGTVRPRRTSEIGFNRIGIVEEILVERGANIEKGTVLAKLSTDSLEATITTLKAKRDAASARLEELIAGPRQQTIQSAINQVNAANADLELANSTAQRTSRLVQIGGASRQDLENADTNLKAKEQMLQVARNTLSELQEGTRPEQIAAQKAMLSELQAAENELRVQLSESTIIAPFAGVVSDRFLEKGAISSPGVPILRLVESNLPEAWVGVSPEYVEQLSDMATPELVVQGERYKGRIKTILPELDKASRTKTVVFELETTKGPDLFGQTISIEVFREVKDRGFWLPQTALVKGDHGLWGAFALDPANSSDEDQRFVLKKRELEVLQIDSDRVYVRGTLKAGDKIVSVGVQRLTPGQSVYLAEPSTKEDDTLGLTIDLTAPVLTQNK